MNALFKTKRLIISLLLYLLIGNFVELYAQSTILISTGGTVTANDGDMFYDAGGPAGNDGNTNRTITLCPPNAGERVALDFTYFKTTMDAMWDDYDYLQIYDGATVTGTDIGHLMGDYTKKYDTSVDPDAVGVENTGTFPLILTPTIFSATNSTGCLTLEFVNGYSQQNIGWEAKVLVYETLGNPGCNISLTGDSSTICNGTTVHLTVEGSVVSAPINNDFNSSSIGTGWETTASASFVNNACSTPSLDGSLYLWMQNAAGPRILGTNAMDVSAGGTVSFEYRQATGQGDSSPCEAPDQQGGTYEGIYLQYSIDGGTSWTTFKYIYPNATEGSFGTEIGLTGCGNYVKQWSKMEYPIPVAARTSSTKFRWIQQLVTGAGYDNWGLDNVVIGASQPSTITLTNLTTSTVISSSSTSPLLADVNPSTTTTYRADITDGTLSCYEDFTVTVNPCGCVSPTIDTQPSSQTICAGNNTTFTIATSGTANGYQWQVNTGSGWNNITNGGVYSGATSNTLTLTGVIAGMNTYQYQCIVTETVGTCPATSVSVSLSVNSIPTATITNNTGSTVLTCSTTSINVTAAGGNSYTWNGGSSTNTDTNSFSSAGAYTVTVTSSGCTNTASITITQNTTPPIASITNNTGTTVLTCSITTISATATGGGTYSWSGGSSANTATNTFNSTGTYTVTVTSANGCTNTASLNITQNNTPPTVSIANNSGTTVLNCTTTSISVTATGGGTYSWSEGSSTSTDANTLTSAGTYTVTVTTTNGCTNTSSITITSDIAVPTATITNNTGTTVLNCTTTNISVTATGGATYTWSGGTATNTASNTLSSAGSYTVTVTAANGCTSIENITITQDASAPTATITNNTGTTELNCSTTNIDVTATGGGTYAWSEGSSTNTATNSFISAGIYTVTVTAANSCTNNASITITSNTTSPTANAGTDYSICSGSSTTLTATGGVSYVWDSGITQGISFTPVATNTYNVTVTGSNGCTSIDDIIVTLNPLPVAAVNPTNTSLCSGSTTLTASGGGTYLWSANAGSATTASVSVSPSSNTTYTVTVSNSCGSDFASSIVNVNGISANITATTDSVCQGESTQLVASAGGDTYLWSPTTGLNNPNIANPIATPATPTTYTVTVSTLSGCSATSSITIYVSPNIVATVNPDNICQGETSVLTVSGGGTYLWSTNEITQNISVTPNTTSTYTVTVTSTDGLCTVNTSATVNVYSLPNVDLGSDIAFCEGNSANLDAQNSGSTFLWSDGSSFQTLTINTSGLFSVTVTNANNCSERDTINVTVNPNPTIVTGSNSPLCEGNTLNLTSSIGGTIYSWSGPDSFTSSSQNPNIPNSTLSSSGVYSVTVTDVNNCVANVSVTITINANPVATANSNSPICEGTTLDFTSSGGTSYSWSGIGGFTSSSQNPSIIASTTAESGTYTVTVTDDNSCASTAQVNVTINATPTVTAGSNSPICSGSTLNLTSTLGISYVWSGQGGYSSSAQNPNISNATTSQSGAYTVSLTDANGCSNIAQTIVTVNSLPIADAGTANQLTCLLTTVTLDASGTSGTSPFTYTWSTTDGNIVSGNSTINPIVNATGIYTVTSTDDNGCIDTDDVFVSEDIIAPTAIAGTANILTCLITNTTIDASASTGSNLTFQWGTSDGNIVSGSNSSTPTVDITGTYVLTLTNSVNGCSDNLSVIVNSDTTVPNLNLSSDISICEGDNLSLSASGGDSYLWSTSETSDIININPLTTETYYITATSTINGCTKSDSVTVTVISQVVANAGNNQSICSGNTITLTASGGTSYIWNTGSTSQSFSETPASSGYYFVTVSVGTCSDTSSVYIDVTQTPIITASITPSASICEGDAIVLKGIGATSYVWSNNVVNNVAFNPISSTTYSVTGTLNNCTGTYSVSVTVNPNPTVNLGSNLDICQNEVAVLDAGNIGSSYSWNDGSTGQTLTVSTTGSYSVNVTSSAGCTGTGSVQVTTHELPTVNAGKDTTVYQMTPLNLNAVGSSLGLDYLWIPSAGLSSATISNPVFFSNTSNIYVVKVVDNNNCYSVDTIVITVIEKPVDGLLVYNIFTPNGDGENDTWIIENIDDYSLNKMFVYNRNGQLVFETEKYQNKVDGKCWDGTYKGGAVPDATYYYILDLGNDSPLVKGYVTIVR